VDVANGNGVDVGEGRVVWVGSGVLEGSMVGDGMAVETSLVVVGVDVVVSSLIGKTIGLGARISRVDAKWNPIGTKRIITPTIKSGQKRAGSL
jgi:hypothetical protein